MKGDLLGRFSGSFNHFPLNEEWQDVTYRYVVLGLPPGSFFTALYSNNFIDMACLTHPSNTWAELVSLGKWLCHIAPPQCYGSAEKVDAWLHLSDEEREKICVDYHLVATAWEVLKETT